MRTFIIILFVQILTFELCFGQESIDTSRTHNPMFGFYLGYLTSRNIDDSKNNPNHSYDSKNMMHTFRLLEIAEEIALYKKIYVQRKDKEELFKIRAGEYEYTELLEKADQKLKRIEKLFKKSDLPTEPDYNYAEKLLFSIRDQYYLRDK